MGLSLMVGVLADLSDPDGADAYARHFEAINRHLESAGMKPHVEPQGCEVWGADMFGYSGLHRVRRLAAYLDCGEELPPPGDEDAADDPVLAAYLAEADGVRPGLWARLTARRRNFARQFDHLLLHSDCEGLYLPADFASVLAIPRESEVPGDLVGSSVRLLDEVTKIAAVLRIPEGLAADSQELLDAAEAQGDADETWRRYGVESYGCVVLAEACRTSIEQRAALLFT